MFHPGKAGKRACDNFVPIYQYWIYGKVGTKTSTLRSKPAWVILMVILIVLAIDLTAMELSDHIQNQDFYLVNREPSRIERLTYPKIVYFNTGETTLAFRTAMRSPTGKWLSGALAQKFGKDPIRIRMMGGTVPVSAFISTLQIPAIIVPMVNADNNQHSPNENIRLGHLQNAVSIFEAILTTPFEE